MSHVTHPKLPVSGHPRSSRGVVLGALLALAVVAAIALVITLSGTSADRPSPVGVQAQPAVRADAGPDESAVAAAIGRATRAPSAASATSRGANTALSTQRPDESRVAAAIAGR